MKIENFCGKKIAVIGYGIEGRAAAEYFLKHKAKVTVCDKSSEINLPQGVCGKTGKDYTEGLNKFDLLVRSPGVRPDRLKTTTPVSSATREVLKQYRDQIIGVTGTKGKGTTATLIAKLLESVGLKVHLGGNIGKAAWVFIDLIEPTDAVVLELSSFQLMDVSVSPHIGVMLMIEPDHLDWHKDMAEYLAAKHRLCAHQSPRDSLIYLPSNNYTLKAILGAKSQLVPFSRPPQGYVRDGKVYLADEQIVSTDEVGLLGKHNLDNISAALSAAHIYLTEKNLMDSSVTPKFAKVLRDFKGLPHRLQLVHEHAGLKYIDDSVSTTPGTAAAATRAIDGPKVMIFGGRAKGGDYAVLGKAVTQVQPVAVALIGEAAAMIKSALIESGYDRAKIVEAEDLDRAVEQAIKRLPTGGSVVLSPGCASFDQFENIYDRGQKFAKIAKTQPN